MNTKVIKRFSTVETFALLLKHREVMFRVIQASDKYHGNAIPEMEFLRYVAEYQQSLSQEVAKEVALVFDSENLLQSQILNDRKSTSGAIKLWFNSSVIEVFRLCKISLYRPLTATSLKATMTPIWSILRELNENNLSITPGTEDYDDWLGEISHRITELLGKIKANITKLERIGDSFQSDLKSESLELTKVKFHEASRLYRREIEPLRIFLAKDTRYEQGDGIHMTLETLTRHFALYGDIESQSLMNRFQLQYLDMFRPIKRVADSVSVYLRKTKSAIIEHNAIESAFCIIRDAYENTLSSDKRNKFLSLKDLVELGPTHPIASIGRVTPYRLEKNPSFLNTVFNELAHRNASAVDADNDGFLFEETVDKATSKKLRHSMRLNSWVEGFQWPMGQDYIELAYETLKNDWDGFSIPDLLEIGGKLHTFSKYKIILTNEFKSIEDSNHKLNYRVRLLKPTSSSPKAAQ